jgi:[ribosomal protein S18]-alanine N-acetyltransferase
MNPAAVTIEPITSLDQIDEVLAIEDAAFINPWTRDMYERDLANRDVSHVVVARTGEGLAVGFCSFWIVLDELHINNLAVLPGQRRLGIGSRLVEHVILEAQRRGASRATLEVRRSNEPAIRLYTRWGFLVSAVRHNYYSQPDEDALILWRENLPVSPLASA